MHKPILLFLSMIFSCMIFSQGQDSIPTEVIFAGYYINEKLDSAGGLKIDVADHLTGEKLGTFSSEKDGFYCIRVPGRAFYQFLISPPGDRDIHFAVIITPASIAAILYIEQYISLVKDKKTKEGYVIVENRFDRSMSNRLRERALKM